MNKPRSRAAANVALEILHVRHLDVFLWLHGGRAPTNPEWDEACVRVADQLRQRLGVTSFFRVLVVSDGGGPSSLQRAKLFRDIYGSQPVKIAALSNAFSNPIVRGIVTAVLWLNPSVRTFQPSDWREAFTYLELAGDEVEIMRAFERMSGDAEPTATLRMLAKEILPYRA